jgi:hypothetical protein
MTISLRFRRAGVIFLLLIAGFLPDTAGSSAGIDRCRISMESASCSTAGNGTSTLDFDGSPESDQEDDAISTLPCVLCGLAPGWQVAHNGDTAVSHEGIDIFHPPPA